MLNFLLVTVGLAASRTVDATDTQKSVGAALLGVGLFRAINELAPMKG